LGLSHIERGSRDANLEAYPRSWAKFLRGTEPPIDVETRFSIRPAEQADATVYGKILAQAFCVPAVAGELFAETVGRPGWHTFVATDGQEVAGVGALFVRGEVAYFGGAATRSKFQKRGAQFALMQKRIGLALELGCRWIVTETGEARAGDPNHSYRNMLRSGFRVVYSRANFAPEGTTWPTVVSPSPVASAD
jgi:GNAT superfamily N-acetyltransferase